LIFIVSFASEGKAFLFLGDFWRCVHMGKVIRTDPISEAWRNTAEEVRGDKMS
jgi:hypothetical protein